MTGMKDVIKEVDEEEEVMNSKSSKHVDWKEESFVALRNYDPDKPLDPDAQSTASGLTWYTYMPGR